ncbi:MAG: CotH kinase family protein [Clostridia bacterium]|nr:CotH kinase family protein [Clostridia bacterium]
MRVYYKSANNTAVGTDGDLNYDLFEGYARDDDGHAITDFSRLLLRNSGNDCMDSFIRDAYMQRVSRELDVYTMAYAPVLLFINGEFWGVYNARERYSPEYVESHTGANKDTVALVESDYHALTVLHQPGAPFIPMDGTQADADEFNALVNYIRSHDLSVQEHYDYVAERLDVNSFMDMYVARLFFNARDWPENNIKVFKNRNADDPAGVDTKWHFSLLDMDMGISMYPAKHDADTTERANFFGWIDATNTVVGTIMHGLCKNAGFKQAFISRFAYVVDRIYTPEFLEAELDAVVSEREPLVALQTKRWGASEKQYRTSIENMYSFVRNREQYVIPMLCSYFGISPDSLDIGTEKKISVSYNPDRAEVTFNGETVAVAGREFVFETESGQKTLTFSVSAKAKEGYSVSSIVFMPTIGEMQTVQGDSAEFTVSSSGTVMVNTRSNGTQTPVAGVQSGITASAHSSYYLSESGDLYAWGMNQNGILGIPGNANVPVPTLVASGVAKVEVCHSNDAENNHNATMMAYLTLDGQLYTVGANGSGQLGRNGTATDDRVGPVKFDKKIKDFSVGYDHLLVLDEEGVLWGVGSNTYGQLGKRNDGGNTTSFQTVATGVKLIAAGRRCTFYTDSSNTCYVLGDNRWEKYGTGSDRFSTPHKLLSDVVNISTGEHQVALVTTKGELYYAGWRQLNGFVAGTGMGKAVKVTDGVKKAVLHHSNMLILKTDGSVWGYGSNMGNAMAGVSATSGTPGKMIAGGVKDIASGYQFSLFLFEDGTIQAQGENTYGQAGNGKAGGSVSMAQALF